MARPVRSLAAALRTAAAVAATGLGTVGWLAAAGVAPAAAQSAAAVQTAGATKAPRNAIVYFHNVREGSRIPQRFTVRIGLKEMGVAPAGVDLPATGHHHVLVDVDALPVGVPIPSDFNHIHLGNGQTEVQLTLTPGRHTLQLLLGDHRHIPHAPPVRSDKITVTVY